MTKLPNKVGESDIIKDDDLYTREFISENNMVTSSEIKSKEDIEKIVLGSGKKLREFLKTYGYDFDYTLSLSHNGKYVGFSSEEIRDPKTHIRHRKTGHIRDRYSKVSKGMR